MAFIEGLAGCKISSALDYSSASTALAGTALDMSGYQGVMMVVKMGAITTGAATSIKAQQATAAAFSTAHDIEGTSVTIADDDDNQIFVLDIRNPIERYVRVYLDRATQAAGASAVYIQYGPDSNPQVNDVTDKVTTETHIFKATGTA